LIFEKTSSGVKFYPRRSKSKITIFALDSERYRGDLEALASKSDFKILFIKSRWQGFLINTLYNGKKVDAMVHSNLVHKKIDPNIMAVQEFMCQFLDRLYQSLSVNCVTTVNYRYFYDSDWTFASESIGVPHIILYRECLLQKGTRIYSEVVERHAKFKFHSSHIIVHNKTCKDSFVESGYCKREDVSVIGALRMDKYLKTINSNKTSNNKRKKFTLFYFPYNMSLFGKNGTVSDDYKYKYAFNIWKERKLFFKDIHLAILELAVEYPEFDFVIKPKDIMMTNSSWLYYEQILKDFGYKNNINNYSVEPNANVHKLIFNSDVICALQSSTVIESAIAGKPIILPVFKNYRKTENYKDFSWKNYLDLFNVADNKDHLKELILQLMNNPTVDGDVIYERKKVFKDFFNDLDGESLKGYANKITAVVESRRQ